ncbi:glycosyltransferase [uncultured Rheinheimera sp.]|uniref:glycosyltransferase n=1 Tax=uncultured Rheinheimera sp. TaxID=400532 RepID=UPI00259AB36C|nr:glycosyltransferase [uncultured Rheinheimera sp.]
MGSFSVLMSVYIKEKPEYLASALDSLVAQTMAPAEVVIVEDGPITAELKAVIESYRAKLPIKSAVSEKNQGLAKALNFGLTFCSYDLVARMDTDDIALPQRFTVQVDFMQQHPDIALSSAYIEEWDDNMEHLLFVKTLPLEHERLKEFVKFRSPMSHPVVIFRKDAVLSVGGYPNIYPEDYPLWCTMISAGYKAANIPQVLLRMRAGNGMMSRRGPKFLKGYLQTYRLMYDLKLITLPRLVINSIIQSAIRYSPAFLLRLLYKYGRS